MSLSRTGARLEIVKMGRHYKASHIICLYVHREEANSPLNAGSGGWDFF